MTFRRFPLLLLCVAALASCTEKGAPFPFVPNLPDDFNIVSRQFSVAGETEELKGPVAYFSHEVFPDYRAEATKVCAAYFDSTGRCTELYYNDKETTRYYMFVYDSTGRRTEEMCYMVAPDTNTLVSSQQPFSRLGGAKASFSSARGLTQTFDSVLTTTRYSYSRNGRRCKARIVSPDGRRHTFRIRYDAAGRVSRFVFPDGSPLSYDYDAAGRLVRMTYPDASVETYQYDKQGHLLSKCGRDGDTLSYGTIRSTDTVAGLVRVEERVEEGSFPIETLYQYDDHGNWVRRTQSQMFKVSRIDIRQIEYY